MESHEEGLANHLGPEPYVGGGNIAMRHTFITNLCRANVSPKTAQALARHGDIRLTMNTYSHVGQQEQAAAIGMLKGG